MTITESDLAAARTVWGDALIAISAAYEDGGIEAATNVAGEALDAAYGYNLGPVLFKPTLASGEQTFRTTREGALAYFVGHSDDYPLDGGFGIKGWRKVEFTTAASFIDGDVAMWMGWVTYRQGRWRADRRQELGIPARRRGDPADCAASFIVALRA